VVVVQVWQRDALGAQRTHGSGAGPLVDEWRRRAMDGRELVRQVHRVRRWAGVAGEEVEEVGRGARRCGGWQGGRGARGMSGRAAPPSASV